MCVFHYIFFFHLFIYRHLGCSHVLAIVNSAAMNIFPQVILIIPGTNSPEQLGSCTNPESVTLREIVPGSTGGDLASLVHPGSWDGVYRSSQRIWTENETLTSVHPSKAQLWAYHSLLESYLWIFTHALGHSSVWSSDLDYLPILKKLF